MSAVEWKAIYQEAWMLYYTPAHMKTLLRRAAATGVPIVSLVKMLVAFATTVALENVHPLQGGVLRLKHPCERRPGLTRERAFVFWPRFAWETLIKQVVLIGTIGRLIGVGMAVARAAGARDYMDQALTPVCDDDEVTLDLLTKTNGAGTAIAHGKKIAALTGAGHPVLIPAVKLDPMPS
jgi:hypothetical protein